MTLEEAHASVSALDTPLDFSTVRQISREERTNSNSDKKKTSQPYSSRTRFLIPLPHPLKYPLLSVRYGADCADFHPFAHMAR